MRLPGSPGSLFFGIVPPLIWRQSMRLVLSLGALALASCGGNAPTNNSAVTEESDATEVTAVNDVTAIDAATGEAAEMAADVNYTFNEEAANDSSAAAENSTHDSASDR